LYIFINIDIGFKSKNNTFITLNNCEISYCSFVQSIFMIDTNNEENLGHYSINNSKFFYNSGYNGGIINIKEIDSSSSVNFNFSTFESNFGSNYGGISYSTSYSSPLFVKFNNCTFINNNSPYGIF